MTAANVGNVRVFISANDSYSKSELNSPRGGPRRAGARVPRRQRTCGTCGYLFVVGQWMTLISTHITICFRQVKLNSGLTVVGDSP